MVSTKEVVGLTGEQEADYDYQALWRGKSTSASWKFVDWLISKARDEAGVRTKANRLGPR